MSWNWKLKRTKGITTPFKVDVNTLSQKDNTYIDSTN